jgi:hypothetical protein
MASSLLFSSPFDLFNETLLINYERLKANPGSRNDAMNCATSGWHIIDSISEQGEAQSNETLAKLRKELECQCWQLRILHDITTSGKHFKISNSRLLPDKGISSAQAGNSYATGYASNYTQKILWLEFEDGTYVSMVEVVGVVVGFWKQYFANQGIITV